MAYGRRWMRTEHGHDKDSAGTRGGRKFAKRASRKVRREIDKREARSSN